MAAADRGLPSVGYNSDMSLQVGDTVLTSVEFKWAKVYNYFVQQMLNDQAGLPGGWQMHEQYFKGYRDGTCGLSQLSWQVLPAQVSTHMSTQRSKRRFARMPAQSLDGRRRNTGPA